MTGELLALMAARDGHFRLESGHHGALWLDVDALFVRPSLLAPFVRRLADRLAAHRIDLVCGPVTGGAVMAALIATELDIECAFAERVADARGAELYAARYRVTESAPVRDRRVAVVDDVINAGSAVRATLADLDRRGAQSVALGAFLVLGSPAEQLAATRRIPLEALESRDNAIWPPAECPACAAGTPLLDVT